MCAEMTENEIRVTGPNSDRSVCVCTQNLTYKLKVKPPAFSRLAKNKNNLSNDTHIPEKIILREINLCAKPGQVLFILGPSGSGKTSLLNLLSGRIRKSKNSQITGDVYYNGVSYLKQNVKNISNYVMQKDNLLEYLTVEETLFFNAALRMKGSTEQTRSARINGLISELGLENCRKNLVGGTFKKGISGGEMKRLSIAIELLDNPQLLFLDEPTSGLDASLAFDILQLIITLAQKANRTIICTVHQPRSQAFSMFDKLLLLSNGETVYNGAAKDALKYFSDLGYTCPPNFNPADFLLDLLSSHTHTQRTGSRLTQLFNLTSISKRQSEENVVRTFSPSIIAMSSLSKEMEKIELDTHTHTDKSTHTHTDKATNDASKQSESSQLYTQDRHHVTQAEIDQLPNKFKQSDLFAHINQQIKESINTVKPQRPSSRMNLSHIRYVWLRQIYYLTRRGLINSFRNPLTNFVRLGVNLFTGIVLGGIFFNLESTGRSAPVATNIFGCLFFLITNISFSSFDSLLTYPQERTIFNRDSLNGTYSASAFFISKTISDAPFTYFGPLCFLIIFYWMTGLAATWHQFLLYLLVGLLTSFSAVGFMNTIGAASPSLNVAQAISPIILVVFLLVSGYFLKDDSIPVWISWFKWLSFMRYGFQALSINQFPPGESWGEIENNFLLTNLAGIYETNLWVMCVALFSLGFGYFCLAFIFLKYTNRYIGIE